MHNFRLQTTVRMPEVKYQNLWHIEIFQISIGCTLDAKKVIEVILANGGWVYKHNY